MSDPQRPVTWRDTYTLVMEMEGRVLSAIGELKADVRRVTDDHEARLRHLEVTNTSSEGKNEGAALVLTAGKAAVLFVLAMIGFLIDMYVVFTTR